MRKGMLTAAVIALICAVLAGTALADYGYTSVDQIPMAVDFDVRVEFDAAGEPHIVTDYPFERNGADEMNLTYDKGDQVEVFTLNYNFRTGKTRVGTVSREYYSDDYSNIYEAIRSGEVTLDDQIYVNTSRFSSETDWFLAYSRSEKNYTAYEEKTHAQTFNGMGEGGVARSAYYNGGRLSASRTLVRKRDADLVVMFNRTGDISDAYVYQYTNSGTRVFSYDQYTGLFSGRPVTELGFDESDMETEAFAAVGARTGTAVQTQTQSVVVQDAGNLAASYTTRMIGGLLSGILMGIILYYMLRRRRQEKKEKEARKADTAPGGSPEQAEAETPEPVEAPQVMSSSSGR